MNPYYCAGGLYPSGAIRASKGAHGFSVSVANGGDYTITFDQDYGSVNYIALVCSSQWHDIVGNRTSAGFVLFVMGVNQSGREQRRHQLRRHLIREPMGDCCGKEPPPRVATEATPPTMPDTTRELPPSPWSIITPSAPDSEALREADHHHLVQRLFL